MTAVLYDDIAQSGGKKRMRPSEMAKGRLGRRE